MSLLLADLNQNQVIEQLEKFVLTTPVLQFYKVPHEEDPTTSNVFLSADDFYFEVSINVAGRYGCFTCWFLSPAASRRNTVSTDH